MRYSIGRWRSERTRDDGERISRHLAPQPRGTSITHQGDVDSFGVRRMNESVTSAWERLMRSERDEIEHHLQDERKRKMRAYGVTLLMNTETVRSMNMCLYVHATSAKQAKHLVETHIRSQVCNITDLSQWQTFTNFSRIDPRSIAFIN